MLPTSNLTTRWAVCTARVVNSGAYPIATFEATDVVGILVKRMGVEPRRPFSGKLNVRLGPELHQRVARAAAESDMSLNRWIQHALEKSVSG